VRIAAASNESENGLGDGDAAADIVVTDGVIQRRAERAGNGSSRVYSLSTTAAIRPGTSPTAYLIRRHRLAPESPATAPEEWPWALTIRALGAFTIAREDEPLTLTGKVRQRPLQLRRTLVALGGSDVPEERLTDLLWPEAEGDAADQAFTVTLHRLRALLSVEGALILQTRRLSLDPRRVWLDAWAFERRALALYRGPFLGSEPGSAWATATRERLRNRFLRTTARLCRHWTESGDRERAAEGHVRGLDVDDLAEEFYRELMRCHEQLGRRAEALRVAERCRATLATVLGVDPSPATQAIARRLAGS
jgi:two-component SAPR family response regulator